MTDPRRYLAGLFLVLAASILPAATAVAQALTIQNQWTGAFISDAGGATLTGDANDPAAQWLFEPVDGSGPERVRNAATGNYLHVEGGALQAGPIDPGAPTAHWAREQVDGETIRFQSLGQPGTYLNVETGPLQSGPVEPGWLSARWIIREVAPATDAPVVADAPSAEEPPVMEEQQQPMETAAEAAPSTDQEPLDQSQGDPSQTDAGQPDTSQTDAPLPLASEAGMEQVQPDDGASLPDQSTAEAAAGAASVPPDAGDSLPEAGASALLPEANVEAPASEDQALAPQDDELLPSPSYESLPEASQAPAYEALPDPGQGQASLTPQDGLLPPPPGGRASGMEAATTDGVLPSAGEPQMSSAASETLPAAPTLAGEALADLPTLSEATGQAPIQLVVQNRSGAPLDVFIGVPGQDPAYVQTVGPGQQLLQQSPAGATWSIAQEDDWVGDYRLSDAPVQLIQFP